MDEVTTLDIILEVLSERQTPGSMGHMIEVNKALDLFTRLRKANLVKDLPESLLAANNHPEITEAILALPKITLMREGGVIR